MNARLYSLARALVEAKGEKFRTEYAAKAAAKRYRELEADFWEELDAAKQPTTTFDLGPPHGRVQFQKRSTVRGRVFNPHAARESLSAMGIEGVFHDYPAVRQAVLNEEVRERLETGQELPDGIDFSETRFVTVTKKG